MWEELGEENSDQNTVYEKCFEKIFILTNTTLSKNIRNLIKCLSMNPSLE